MNNVIDIREADLPVERPIGTPLRELFLEELADMKSSEHQLTLAIPLLIRVAKGDELRELLKIHLKETEGHLATVQQVAESMGEELPKKTCKAMKGMLKEGVALVVKNIMSQISDVALIASAQKIEHYEIASYGTLCEWAKELGLKHEVALLTSIREQEKMADVLLTGLAMGQPLKELVERTSLKKAKTPMR